MDRGQKVNGSSSAYKQESLLTMTLNHEDMKLTLSGSSYPQNEKVQ